MNGSKDVSVVNVELPSDLAERVRTMAAKLGLSSEDVVRAALIKGIACAKAVSGPDAVRPVDGDTPPRRTPPEDPQVHKTPQKGVRL